MPDFDSNPFADSDLNNPFKVRLRPVGGHEPFSVPRRGQSELHGSAASWGGRGTGPKACGGGGGHSQPREVGKGQCCRVALASGVWRALIGSAGGACLPRGLGHDGSGGLVG